jgi:hypothetical protein
LLPRSEQVKMSAISSGKFRPRFKLGRLEVSLSNISVLAPVSNLQFVRSRHQQQRVRAAK